MISSEKSVPVFHLVFTDATETTTGVPISDKYKVIPANMKVVNVTHVSIVNRIYLLVITIYNAKKFANFPNVSVSILHSIGKILAH